MSFHDLYNNYNNPDLDIIKEEENIASSVAESFVTNTENDEVQGGIPVTDFELPPRSLYHDIEEDDLSDAGCVAPDDDDDESSMPDFSTAGLVSALGTEGVEDYMMTAITPAIMPRKSKTPYRTTEALSFAESTDLLPSPAAVADMPDTPEKGVRELAVVTAAASVPPGSPQPIKSPTLTTAEVLNVLNAREASERSRCRLLVIAASLTGLLVIGIALGAVFGMKPAASEPTPRWAKDDASSENPPSTEMKTKIPMPSSEAPASPAVSPAAPSAESPILPTAPILTPVPTFVPVFPTVPPQFIMSTPPTWRPTTKRPTTKRPTTKAPTTASPTDSPAPSPSPSKSPSFSVSPTDSQVPSGHPSLRPSRSKAPSRSLHPTKSPAPSPLPSFVPTKTETPTTSKEQKNNGKRERRRRRLEAGKASTGRGIVKGDREKTLDELE